MGTCRPHFSNWYCCHSPAPGSQMFPGSTQSQHVEGKGTILALTGNIITVSGPLWREGENGGAWGMKSVSLTDWLSVFMFHELAITDSPFLAFSGYVCVCPSGCSIFDSMFMFHRPAITQFLAFFLLGPYVEGGPWAYAYKEPYTLKH